MNREGRDRCSPNNPELAQKAPPPPSSITPLADFCVLFSNEVQNLSGCTNAPGTAGARVGCGTIERSIFRNTRVAAHAALGPHGLILAIAIAFRASAILRARPVEVHADPIQAPPAGELLARVLRHITIT